MDGIFYANLKGRRFIRMKAKISYGILEYLILVGIGVADNCFKWLDQLKRCELK